MSSPGRCNLCKLQRVGCTTCKKYDKYCKEHTSATYKIIEEKTMCCTCISKEFCKICPKEEYVPKVSCNKCELTDTTCLAHSTRLKLYKDIICCEECQINITCTVCNNENGINAMNSTCYLCKEKKCKVCHPEMYTTINISPETLYPDRIVIAIARLCFLCKQCMSNKTVEQIQDMVRKEETNK